MIASPDEEWVNNIITHVPRAIREDIIKGRFKAEPAKHGIKSLTEDPLSLQYSLGFKDRRYSLTYQMLKRIPRQLSIVAAIIQTRCNQVGSFSVPYRLSGSVGFQITHKDKSRETSKSERKFIEELEAFIYNCGNKDPNPHNSEPRDDFETFLKKLVRDSLMFDQCTFEVVPDRRGQPYEFIAVDASTIRLAAPNLNQEQLTSGGIGAPPNVTGHRPPQMSPNPWKMLELNGRDRTKPVADPAFVQVVNGQIETVYTHDELSFGVRNPRSDIYSFGYGYGELEQLITIITAHLYAEEYNRRFFMQGSAPKGILNFKGDNLTPDQLEGFKRQWRANLEGVENSWRTPILQSEQGLEWINLHPTNQEMEYGQWMEYLIKVTCAVFLIDPAELNFDLHGGVQQTPLFESSNEWKLKASRDRGLKPMLRFIAKMINKNVIDKIDDNFMFDFIGLDELTEQEKHELRKEQVASYMTLNEIRDKEDLPRVPDGDVILNPTYLQAKQVKMQIDQMAQQMDQQQSMMAGGEEGGAPAEGGGEEGGAPPGGPAEETPEYADTVTKGLNILEIDIDEFIALARGEE